MWSEQNGEAFGKVCDARRMAAVSHVRQCTAFTVH